MKRILLSILLALGITAAASCGSNDPDVLSGRIVGLEYDDPDDWVSMVCVVYGKYGCQVWAPIYHHDDAHWSMQLECDKSAEPKGKVYRTWYETDEAQFDTLRHGDWWPQDSEGHCTIEEKKK